jgi:predicted DNA-binding protein with PD1-like motif
MKWTRLPDQSEVGYVLILDKEDELLTELSKFIADEQIEGAHFSAIGAFSSVTLGYFDRVQRDYLKIPVNEQVEVLSLLGDVALQQGKPKLHMHVVIGKRDGQAMGGHLLRATVWPTLEIMLTEIPPEMRREFDPATGLALISVRNEGALQWNKKS